MNILSLSIEQMLLNNEELNGIIHPSENFLRERIIMYNLSDLE